MTSKVSEAEISEFREIFNLVDRNGSGSITKQELSDLLETLGLDTNEEGISFFNK
jgi:calmodulin